MKINQGFTLIEVMVALAILGMSSAALFGIFSKSFWNLRKLEDVHQYQLASEDVLTRVEFLRVLPPEGEARGVIRKSGALWKATIHPWLPKSLEAKPTEAIMKIDVEVSWQGRSGPLNVKLEAIKRASIGYDRFDLQQAIENALPQ
jgi:prepilin-type N-terminal cleavage/methylation domain-containing protein